MLFVEQMSLSTMLFVEQMRPLGLWGKKRPHSAGSAVFLLCYSKVNMSSYSICMKINGLMLAFNAGRSTHEILLNFDSLLIFPGKTLANLDGYSKVADLDIRKYHWSHLSPEMKQNLSFKTYKY